MGKINPSAAKGCGILAAVVVGVPLLIVGVVGVKTWVPLQRAGETLVELDRSLGSDSVYVPTPSGEIPTERMELFLELREMLISACGDYGTVQKGFNAVESLESKDSGNPHEVGDVAVGLGGAALSITPFLARYFELRNDVLFTAPMGLQEYSYIYAVAYHDRLLSDEIQNEIFSNGEALSPEAAMMLRGCLRRQLEAMPGCADETSGWEAVETELNSMEVDPSRLLWQDGLPDAVLEGVASYRKRLDQVFCGATAGLEMEQDARRALWIAIE